MKGSAHSKSSKNKTYPLLSLLLIALLIKSDTGVASSPHTVYKLTWEVLSQVGEVIYAVTEPHALGTWWPTLWPEFCDLVAGLDTWDIPHCHPKACASGSHFYRRRRALMDSRETTPGCVDQRAREQLSSKDFYVHPRDGHAWQQAQKCGGYDYFFCAAWGCETTGDAYWRPSSSWDKIQVRRGWDKGQSGMIGRPLAISFTAQGKQAPDWQTGYTWGLRWYLHGPDRGVIFTIRCKVAPVNSQAIGPNQVLADQKQPSLLCPRLIPGP